MEEIFSDTTFWQAVGYVVGVAIALLFTAFTAKYGAKYSKEAVFYIRKYKPQAIEAVNETTDPVIVWLDKVIPGKADNVLVIALPALINSVADNIKEGE